MRRYVLLLLVGVLASAGGLLWMRQLRDVTTVAQSPAVAETTSLALVVSGLGLEPALASVPKDRLVVLEVRNQRPVPVTLALQGYEDRFVAGPIAPGASWRGAFVADRPGEAFPWNVGGVEVGRLTVTGSHLVEGHR